MPDAAREPLISEGRFADAAELLEERADGDPARHRELAALWMDHLGRVDKALHHYGRAWELAGDREAIAAMRKLHASLGADAEVASLYEEELAVESDAEKAAALELELALLLQKQGDLEAAARHLESSLARAASDRARDALAEVLAAVEGGAPRAVALCRELAATRRAAGDVDGAVRYLRRALGLDPAGTDAAAALGDLLREAGRWSELDRLYQQRGMVAERAVLLAEKLGDREEAKRCWESLGEAGLAPLRALYTASGDWEKLAGLVERGLAARAPAERAADLLMLAQVARDRLADRQRGAGYLRRLLSEDPAHPEARKALADHLRDRRDWRGLADLQAAEAERAEGAERLTRLQELAETCEQQLGDVERANAAWKRLAELDPERPAAREALRRLGARSKMWESLIAVLHKEAAAAGDARGKAEAVKRMAGVFRERQVDPLRAIQLYEEALELAPGDTAALKALAELYERQGDDKGVLRTLRRQLEATAVKPAQLTGPARIERLGLLRRTAQLGESAGDIDAVVFACTAVLEIAPGEREALDRLERVLERAGDAAGLESALAYHAEAAGGHADRARALRRLAKVADQRGDALSAMERWEALVKVAPNDREALEALASHYEQAKRPVELAAVLERLVDAPRAVHDEVGKAAARRRYALVLDEQVDDRPRAVKAWRRVLDAHPRDREALERLAALTYEMSAWRDLTEILARQSAVLAVDAPGEAVTVARARAKLLERELHSPREAATALADLIAGVGPADLDAHEELARLQVSLGDLDGAARTLERLVWLAPAAEDRIAALRRIGDLARGPLADPRRALQAYERALELSPDDREVLAETAALYARVGEWTHHVAILERLADTQEGEERLQTLAQLAHGVEEHLGDARDAFRWRRKAHELARRPETLDELRRAAQRHDLRVELIEVLEIERRAARSEAPLFIALSREIAGLFEKGGDFLRAITVLGEAVGAAPDDDSLHAEAERVAAASGERAAWQAVLSVTQAALHARLGPVRVRLHDRRARILDDRLGDASAAMDELIAAFALVPAAPARAAIEALAARTGRWQDLLRVDGVLYRLETTPAGKVKLLRRGAIIVEEKIGDRVRAFRGLLRALRRAPDDAEVRADLWRLARLIGTYGPAQQAEAHLPDAEVSLEPLFTIAIAPRGRDRPDATIPLSIEDILDDLAGGPRKDRPDSTIQLSLDDVELQQPRAAVSLPPPIPARRVAAARGPRPTMMNRYATAWEELAAAFEGLRAEGDAGRAKNLVAAADVWDRGAGDPRRAIDALLRARQLAPAGEDRDGVHGRLYRMAAERKVWPLLAERLIHAADASQSPGATADLLLEAATVRVQHDVASEAEGLYRRVLGIRPEDAPARAGLERLFREEKRWAELAESLEERVDPRLGSPAPAAERPGLLAELARMYEVELGRPYQAIEALEQLAASDPETHERLGRLYEKLGRWAKAIEALGKVAELSGDTPRARAARARIADIYERELEEPERARALRELLARSS